LIPLPFCIDFIKGPVIIGFGLKPSEDAIYPLFPIFVVISEKNEGPKPDFQKDVDICNQPVLAPGHLNAMISNFRSVSKDTEMDGSVNIGGSNIAGIGIEGLWQMKSEGKANQSR
jgi:hypothetical protein